MGVAIMLPTGTVDVGVMFLVGVSGVTVPKEVLFTSVFVFIVIPLALGSLSRAWLLKWKGVEWFESKYLRHVCSLWAWIACPRSKPYQPIRLCKSLVM